MKKQKVNLTKLALSKQQLLILSQQTQTGIAGGATNVSGCHPLCLTVNYTVCITACNQQNCA